MLNYILMLAPAAAQNPDATFMDKWGGMLMMVAIFVVFYFFMIRPQSKRQKEIKKFRDSLKQGDKVITAGGIHGKIKNVKENTVTLEIADGMNITVEKTSIYATAPEESEQPQK